MLALVMGAWLPRIPEIQLRLDLDISQISVVFLGAPLGIFLSLTFAGKLVDRLGSRAAIALFFPLYYLAMLLPPVSENQQQLTISMFIAGIMLGVLDLACNVMADEMEKATSTRLMNSAHGLWSLGLLAGTLVGWWAASHEISPHEAAFMLVLLIPVPAALLAINLPRSATPKERADGHDKPEDVTAPMPKHRRWNWPHPQLLGVCFFTFGATFTEGAVADWAGIYMRDIVDADRRTIGYSLAAFALVIAVTRILADPLRRHFPAATIARTTAMIGLSGTLVIGLARTLPVAVAGFALVGIGAAIAFPLAVTAAAAAPGPSPARNVALLTFIALTSFLVAPPAIGFIAAHSDIRTGLLLLFPMLLLSVLLSKFADSRPPQPDSKSQQAPATP